MQRKLYLSPNSNFRRMILMGSRNFLLLKSSDPPAVHARVIPHHSCSSYLQTNNFHSSSRKNNLSLFPSSKHFPAIYQRASGYSYTPNAAMSISSPITGVEIATLDNQSSVDEKQLMILRQKLQTIGIDGESYLPGQYNALLCPSCKGGDSGEKSLSLNISQNGGQAEWTCFRAKCGWRGETRAFANVASTCEHVNEPGKEKQPIRTITEESLGLEPLCNELLGYFAERLISGETLRRNSVMQKKTGDRKAIAFPYKHNGQLVGCKYRTLEKKFWQAKNSEKVFYGIDDIVDADEIIIVEGEIDKLSVDEAGYYNCISVPSGAPQKLSLKELPSLDKDTAFQYLWNCKDYLDKASRIILATDGDIPGQALAEGLARRLGEERCRRVHWPKKDEAKYFNDANEVLVNLGAEALRDAIDKAEKYQMQKLD